MRNARKVLLLAVMALAAMAVAAQSASAALSIANETAGGACPAVSISGSQPAGGCLIHAKGEAELRKHVFGVESHITTCTNEYHGRVSSTGSGWIFEQVLTNDAAAADPNCTRQPCKVNGEATPWKADGFEGAANNNPEPFTEWLTTNFCVEPIGGGTDETCEIDVGFNETVNHRYEFGHEGAGTAAEMSSHGVSGFRCEIIGHWAGETGGTEDGASEVNVEVNHV